jgi:hypothetical protein
MRKLTSALMCAALVLAACGSDDDVTVPDPTRADDPRSILEVDLGRGGSLVTGAGFTVVVDDQDFTGPGSVSVEPTNVEPPDGVGGLAGFLAAGDPVELALDGDVDGPVTLELSAEIPQGALGVILRHDAELGWYPIGTAGQNGTVTAERTSFSPVVAGWFLNVADAVSGVTRELLGKRHDPPPCEAPAPSWFGVDPPAIDVVHACQTSNTDPATGIERGEIQIVNNRGFVLEVQVPPGAAYAFVDGQPEPVRIVGRAFTGRDSVLLAPGQFMSVGFERPEDGAFIPLRVDLSLQAAAMSLILELAGGLDGPVGALFLLADCGIAPEPLDVSVGVDGLSDGLSTFISCFSAMASDPGRVAIIANESIAAIAGVSPVQAASDVGLAKQIDRLAGGLRKAAAALAVVDIGATLIDVAADLYRNSEAGDFNALSPGISFRAQSPQPPAPAPRVPGCPNPTGRVEDAEQMLRCFAAAWEAGNQQILDNLVSPDARAELESLEGGSFLVPDVFPASCLQGSSGAGGCDLLYVDEGQTECCARIYFFSYVVEGEGDFYGSTIVEITFAGDAG